MKEFVRSHVRTKEFYKKYYDRQGVDKTFGSITRADRMQPTYWALRKALDHRAPPCDVLDVGTQSGKNALIMSLFHYNVVATDVSETYIEQSKASVGEVMEKRIRWAALPVEDIKKFGRGYDIILCLSVLEHVANFQEAMNALFSVSREGTLILITVPINNSWAGDEHTRAFYEENVVEDFPPGSEIDKMYYSSGKVQMPDGSIFNRGWFTVSFVVDKGMLL